VRALAVVLARAEMAQILEDLPGSVATLEAARVLVAVPPARGDLEGLAVLRERNWSPEILEVGRRSAYLGLPGGIADSRLAAALDAATKRRVTSRNLATMRKLVALMEAEAT
jgi:uncharacterized protein (DUF1697 family)